MAYSTTMASGMSVFSLHEPPEAMHTCRVCPKSFKRAEHRNRHERTHSRERPFVCRFCSRRYSRGDLVTRHEKTVHREEPASLISSRPTAKPSLPVNDSTTGYGTDDGNGQPTQPHVSVAAADAAITITDAHHSPLLDVHLLPPSMNNPNQQHLDPSDTTNIPVVHGSRDFAVTPAQHDFNLDAAFGDAFSYDACGGLSPSFFDVFFDESFDQFAQALAPDEGTPQDSSQGTSVPSGDSFSAPGLRAASLASPEARDWNPDTHLAQQDDCQNLRQQPRAENPHGLVFTEDIKARCFADLKSHLTTKQIGNFQLPDLSTLQHCLDRYIEVFHIHFPFLHLPTLELTTAPSPLILVICAIGALYRLERRLAASLCFMAERVLASLEMGRLEHDPVLSPNWARPPASPAIDLVPLSIAQARLLVVFLLGFSGEPGLVRRALIGCGYISADFRLRRSIVQPSREGRNAVDWKEWVARESMKRYMCTCIILGNLLNIAYGINPGFSALEECDVEIPDDDVLWDTTTATAWESLIKDKPSSPQVSLGKAASSFFSDSDHRETLTRVELSWSPFTISAVMHQVAIAVWYQTQGQQACNVVARDAQQCSQPEATRIETALSRCRKLLIRRSGGGKGKGWSDGDSPLLFNASTILRVSYGRAFMAVEDLDRSLLFKNSTQDMVGALRRYHSAPQKRGQLTTLAVNRALEGFAIPIRAGSLLMQKTAAFKWSVEHALAAWDAALLVTKWVHTVEQLQESGQGTAPEERQVLQNVRQLLSEIETEHARPHSLAAELARVWAGLYDDTWVWGVAPSIGRALRELAVMYEQGNTVL